MTTREQIAKIKTKGYEHEKLCSCRNDVPWLIQELEKALDMVYAYKGLIEERRENDQIAAALNACSTCRGREWLIPSVEEVFELTAGEALSPKNCPDCNPEGRDTPNEE